MPRLRAAIRLEDIGDRPLRDVSAADFLGALQGSRKLPLLQVWSEKKKFELEVEPVFDDLPVLEIVDLLEEIRGEKKKVERELPPGGWGTVDPVAREGFDARLDQLSQRLDQLAERIGGEG